jgi:hypothetical protein
MTSAIQEHISDIMKSLDNAITQIEQKANEVVDKLSLESCRAETPRQTKSLQ